MKWTTDTFKERMKMISPNIEVVGEYIKSAEKVKCICNVCGYQWEATPNKLLMGRNCVKCYRRRRAEQDKITEEEFLKRMKENAPDVEVIGKYNSFETDILCKCKKCGYKWLTLPKRVSRGVTCSNCAGNIKKKTSDFVRDMAILNENIEILGEYINNRTKISCRCKLCGNKWYSTPSRLQNGQGCPSCAHAGTSYVEQFILHAFKLVSQEVYSRDKSQIGMELDIYVPEFKIAIEPGAWDIHKKKIERDYKKIQKCKEKGINLIIIYFLCKNELHDIKSENNVFWYPEDLALERNQEKLLELVYILFSMVGIKTVISAEQICEIKKIAYIQSRKITPEEFKKKLIEISPNIEIIGTYKSTKEKIKCRCSVCEYEWDANPQNLLNGHGCIQCAGNKKKTVEEFEVQLKNVNNNIIILGGYENAHSHIECKCKVCGYIWKGTPNALLKGHGCPQCAIEKRKQLLKMTTADFKLKLSEINKNIIVIGEYVNTHTKIDCQCTICGCIFVKRPHDLLVGQGCPWCAGRKKSKNIKVLPNGEANEDKLF